MMEKTHIETHYSVHIAHFHLKQLSQRPPLIVSSRLPPSPPPHGLRPMLCFVLREEPQNSAISRGYGFVQGSLRQLRSVVGTVINTQVQFSSALCCVYIFYNNLHKRGPPQHQASFTSRLNLFSFIFSLTSPFGRRHRRPREVSMTRSHHTARVHFAAIGGLLMLFRSHPYQEHSQVLVCGDDLCRH